MNQNNENGDWYEQSQSDSFYEKAPVSISSAPPIQAKPKNINSRLLITLIIVGVLILIALSALIFSGTGNRDIDLPVITNSGSGRAGGNASDDFGDFSDFFENYYTSTSGSGSNLERGETGTGVTLSLTSSKNLEKLTLQEVYAKCADSVVSIIGTINGYAGYYWGSGIVMTEDGYILTNAHVIEGTDHVSVCLADGTEYTALLIGEDPISDIAVLKIDAFNLKAAEFGISDELVVGDTVIAIGNPLGEEFAGTMTDGIISAINRGVNVSGNVMTLIQTNAALNEGNSGGPLINSYGQVIGITNMKMAADYTSVTIEGIGFAIPTATIKNVADELIENGKVSGRPSIGITAGAIPDEAKSQYNLPAGIYVSEVNPDSDAYEKGITAGDVITAVNSIAVASVDDVNAIKNNFKVGDSLTLTVFRDGKTFDVDIVLYDTSAN